MAREFDSDVVVPKLFDLMERIKQNGFKSLKKDEFKYLTSLTLKQKKCLLVLAFLEPQNCGVSLKTLAGRLDMTLSATSVLVESMVQKDLLHRQVSTQDRRAVRIELTAAGREVFLQSCKHIQFVTNDLWKDIPPEDLLVFADVVDSLHKKICIDL